MDRSARGDRRPRREPAFPLLDRRGRPPVPAGLQDRRRPGPGGRVRARQRLGAPGQQHAAAEGVLRAHAADRAAAPVGVEGVLRVPDLGTRPVVPDAGAAADDLGRPARGTAGGGAGSGVPGSGGVRRVELGHRRRPSRPVLHADRRRLGPVRQHQGAAADPVAARPAARHSAAHSRTIQTTNTPTPKREERPSGVDPSRLKTDPSRNTRATIRPAMPNHRHSSPVRNPAREIVAASAVTAKITGTRPWSWNSARTAAGSFVSATPISAVSAALETKPSATKVAPATRTAAASVSWPARQRTGTSGAMKAMKASSASPTATSLARRAPRCAMLYAATAAPDEPSGPSPCSTRRTTYRTTNARPPVAARRSDRRRTSTGLTSVVIGSSCDGRRTDRTGYARCRARRGGGRRGGGRRGGGRRGGGRRGGGRRCVTG